jgi:hypothetical protein
MLDYNRRESAPGSRCMHAVLGRGVQLPNTDVKGVESPMHHILGVGGVEDSGLYNALFVMCVIHGGVKSER